MFSKMIISVTIFHSVFLAILVLLGGCTSTSKVQTTDNNFENIAKEKFGEGVTFTNSPQDSYVLCMKEEKGTSENPQNHLEYFTYDLKGKKIVLENSLDNGNVSWYSDYQLEVVTFPGTMAEGQTLDDYTKIINLRTGKSISKKDLKEKE